MNVDIFCYKNYTVVTCKIKHLQNISKNVLEPPTSRGYAVQVKMFYFTCNDGVSFALQQLLTRTQ